MVILLFFIIIILLGASKQLGTIIEGESLLNDGAAIVLFNVLLYELIPGQSQSGMCIHLHCVIWCYFTFSW